MAQRISLVEKQLKAPEEDDDIDDLSAFAPTEDPDVKMCE